MSTGNIAQVRKVLEGFMPQIAAAAVGRENVAGAWARVRATADEMGLPLPPGGIQTMNRLYHIEVTRRNAGEAFDRAAPDSPITAAMIGLDISSRPGAGTGTEQKWLVRYEGNTGTAEEPRMEWLTWAQQGPLPGTKADLIDELMLQGNRMTDTPTGPVVGIGTVQIAAV